MNRAPRWKFVTRRAALATVCAILASLAFAKPPIRSNSSIQSRYTVARPAALTIDPSLARNKSLDAVRAASIPKSALTLGLSRQDAAFSKAFRDLSKEAGLTSPTVGSLFIKLPAQPKTTVGQLANRIATQPNLALGEQHPEVGEIGQRFDANSNLRALQSLAQGLKARVDFDATPIDFKIHHLQDQLEATDTLNEIVAAGVERALAWNPANDAKLRSAFTEAELWLTPLTSPSKNEFGLPRDPLDRFVMNAKSDIERRRDLETLETYMENRLAGAFDRLGLPKAHESGIWGQYVRDAHAQVTVRRFSLDANGNAIIKLDTPEFQNLTGRFPLKEIAKELARKGDDPEVKMLLPRQ